MISGKSGQGRGQGLLRLINEDGKYDKAYTDEEGNKSKADLQKERAKAGHRAAEKVPVGDYPTSLNLP